MATDLSEFLQVIEISDASRLAGPLFRRKYGAEPPAEPRHFLVVYRTDSGAFLPVTYLHCRPFGEVCLVGGACTDGNVIRQMHPDHQVALTPDNSAMLMILQFAFAHLEREFDAFFGYCGDARALQVDLQAGFVETEHPHVLVKWNKPLHPKIQQALTAKVLALGPF